MASEKKTKLKPLDAGFKRNLMILGGCVTIGLLVVGGFMMMSSKNVAPTAAANLGRVIPAASGEVTDISQAEKERLQRVQAAEAQAARKSGKSYIPDTVLGRAEPVAATKQQRDGAPPKSSNNGSYAQYNDAQRQVTGNRNETPDEIALRKALQNQLAVLVAGMQPATEATVDIADPNKQGNGALGANAMQTAYSAGANGASQASAAPKKELIGGDIILPAIFTTPVDTYKTKFALAELQGGAFDGALLRGEVIPLSQSGDVEDVGVHFTSMRFKGQLYSIDATALNEETATDAMNGDVDHRVLSRYVMPILVAGFSGLSTYFTAKGTPQTSVATGTGTTTDAVIVNQDRASQEDAKNQGIGDAINKGVQISSRQVEKESDRPNRVTVPAQTPIGVIFNTAVLAK